MERTEKLLFDGYSKFSFSVICPSLILFQFKNCQIEINFYEKLIIILSSNQMHNSRFTNVLEKPLPQFSPQSANNFFPALILQVVVMVTTLCLVKQNVKIVHNVHFLGTCDYFVFKRNIWSSASVIIRCLLFRSWATCITRCIKWSLMKIVGQKGAGKTEIGRQDAVLRLSSIPYFKNTLSQPLEDLYRLQKDEERLPLTDFCTPAIHSRQRLRDYGQAEQW